MPAWLQHPAVMYAALAFAFFAGWLLCAAVTQGKVKDTEMELNYWRAKYAKLAHHKRIRN